MCLLHVGAFKRQRTACCASFLLPDVQSTRGWKLLKPESLCKEAAEQKEREPRKGD